MNKKASFQRKLKVLVVLGLYMILMSGCGLSDSGTVNTVTNDDTGTVSELVFSFLKVHSRAENGSILMNWENLSEEKYSKVEIVAEPVGGKNGKKIEITIPRGYHDEELIAEENMRYELHGLTELMEYKITVAAMTADGERSVPIARQIFTLKDSTPPLVPLERLEVLAEEAKSTVMWGGEENTDVEWVHISIKQDGAEVQEPIKVKEKEGRAIFSGLLSNAEYTAEITVSDINGQETEIIKTLKILPGTQMGMKPESVGGLEVRAVDRQGEPADEKLLLTWKTPVINDASDKILEIKVREVLTGKVVYKGEINKGKKATLPEAELAGTVYESRGGISIQELYGKKEYEIEAVVYENGRYSEEVTVRSSTLDEQNESEVELELFASQTQISARWEEPKINKETETEKVLPDYKGVLLIIKSLSETVKEEVTVLKGVTEYVFKDLKKETPYTVQARTIDEAGNQGILWEGRIETLRLQNTELPSRVTGVSVEYEYSGDDATAVISWSASEDPSAMGYKVEIWEGVTESGSTLLLSDILARKVTTFEAKDLVRGEQYKAILRTYNLEGNEGSGRIIVLSPQKRQENPAEDIATLEAGVGKLEIIVKFKSTPSVNSYLVRMLSGSAEISRKTTSREKELFFKAEDGVESEREYQFKIAKIDGNELTDEVSLGEITAPVDPSTAPGVPDESTIQLGETEMRGGMGSVVYRFGKADLTGRQGPDGEELIETDVLYELYIGTGEKAVLNTVTSIAESAGVQKYVKTGELDKTEYQIKVIGLELGNDYTFGLRVVNARSEKKYSDIGEGSIKERTVVESTKKPNPVEINAIRIISTELLEVEVEASDINGKQKETGAALEEGDLRYDIYVVDADESVKKPETVTEIALVKNSYIAQGENGQRTAQIENGAGEIVLEAGKTYYLGVRTVNTTVPGEGVYADCEEIQEIFLTLAAAPTQQLELGEEVSSTENVKIAFDRYTEIGGVVAGALDLQGNAIGNSGLEYKIYILWKTAEADAAEVIANGEEIILGQDDITGERYNKELTGLNPVSDYYIVVKVEVQSDRTKSVHSNVLKITTKSLATVPPAPVNVEINVAAGGISRNSIALRWESGNISNEKTSTGETLEASGISYTVYAAVADDGRSAEAVKNASTIQQEVEAGLTEVVLEELIEGMSYEVLIESVNESDREKRTPGQVQLFETLGLATAPSSVIVEVAKKEGSEDEFLGSSYVKITWTVPEERGLKNDGAEIQAADLKYTIYYVAAEEEPTSDEIVNLGKFYEETEEGGIVEVEGTGNDETENPNLIISDLKSGSQYYVLVEAENTTMPGAALRSRSEPLMFQTASVPDMSGKLEYAGGIETVKGDKGAVIERLAPLSEPDVEGTELRYGIKHKSGTRFSAVGEEESVRINEHSGEIEFNRATITGAGIYTVTVRATGYKSQTKNVEIHNMVISAGTLNIMPISGFTNNWEIIRGEGMTSLALARIENLASSDDNAGLLFSAEVLNGQNPASGMLAHINNQAITIEAQKSAKYLTYELVLVPTETGVLRYSGMKRINITVKDLPTIEGVLEYQSIETSYGTAKVQGPQTVVLIGSDGGILMPRYYSVAGTEELAAGITIAEESGEITLSSTLSPASEVYDIVIKAEGYKDRVISQAAQITVRASDTGLTVRGLPDDMLKAPVTGVVEETVEITGGFIGTDDLSFFTGLIKKGAVENPAGLSIPESLTGKTIAITVSSDAEEGSYMLEISPKPGVNYSAGSVYMFTVEGTLGAVNFAVEEPVLTKIYGDSPFTLGASVEKTAGVLESLVYSISSGNEVLEISNEIGQEGRISIKKAGTATARVEATAGKETVSAEIEIQVEAKALSTLELISDLSDNVAQVPADSNTVNGRIEIRNLIGSDELNLFQILVKKAALPHTTGISIRTEADYVEIQLRKEAPAGDDYVLELAPLNDGEKYTGTLAYSFEVTGTLASVNFDDGESLTKTYGDENFALPITIVKSAGIDIDLSYVKIEDSNSLGNGTVSVDEAGIVQIGAAGRATIQVTATAADVSKNDTIEITVLQKAIAGTFSYAETALITQKGTALSSTVPTWNNAGAGQFIMYSILPLTGGATTGIRMSADGKVEVLDIAEAQDKEKYIITAEGQGNYTGKTEAEIEIEIQDLISVEFSEASESAELLRYGGTAPKLETVVTQIGSFAVSEEYIAQGDSVSVDENGNINILKAGQTTVQAKATALGKSVTADLLITVEGKDLSHLSVAGEPNINIPLAGASDNIETYTLAGFVGTDDLSLLSVVVRRGDAEDPAGLSVVPNGASPQRELLVTVSSDAVSGADYILEFTPKDNTKYTGTKTYEFALGITDALIAVSFDDGIGITKRYGDAPFDLAVTVNKSGTVVPAISFSAQDSSVSVSSAGTVSIHRAGSSTVEALVTDSSGTVANTVTSSIQVLVEAASTGNLTVSGTGELALNRITAAADDTVNTEELRITNLIGNDDLSLFDIAIFKDSSENPAGVNITEDADKVMITVNKNAIAGTDYTVKFSPKEDGQKYTGILSYDFEVLGTLAAVDFDDGAALTKIYGDADFNLPVNVVKSAGITEQKTYEVIEGGTSIEIVDFRTGLSRITGTGKTKVQVTVTGAGASVSDFIEIDVSPREIEGTFSYTESTLLTPQGTALSGTAPIWTNALEGQTVSYSITAHDGQAAPNGIQMSSDGRGVIEVGTETLAQSIQNYTVTAIGTGNFVGTKTVVIAIEVQELRQIDFEAGTSVEKTYGDADFFLVTSVAQVGTFEVRKIFRVIEGNSVLVTGTGTVSIVRAGLSKVEVTAEATGFTTLEKTIDINVSARLMSTAAISGFEEDAIAAPANTAVQSETVTVEGLVGNDDLTLFDIELFKGTTADPAGVSAVRMSGATKIAVEVTQNAIPGSDYRLSLNLINNEKYTGILEYSFTINGTLASISFVDANVPLERIYGDMNFNLPGVRAVSIEQSAGVNATARYELIEGGTSITITETGQVALIGIGTSRVKVSAEAAGYATVEDTLLIEVTPRKMSWITLTGPVDKIVQAPAELDAVEIAHISVGLKEADDLADFALQVKKGSSIAAGLTASRKDRTTVELRITRDALEGSDYNLIITPSETEKYTGVKNYNFTVLGSLASARFVDSTTIVKNYGDADFDLPALQVAHSAGLNIVSYYEVSSGNAVQVGRETGTVSIVSGGTAEITARVTADDHADLTATMQVTVTAKSIDGFTLNAGTGFEDGNKLKLPTSDLARVGIVQVTGNFVGADDLSLFTVGITREGNPVTGITVATSGKEIQVNVDKEATPGVEYTITLNTNSTVKYTETKIFNFEVVLPVGSLQGAEITLFTNTGKLHQSIFDSLLDNSTVLVTVSNVPQGVYSYSFGNVIGTKLVEETNGFTIVKADIVHANVEDGDVLLIEAGEEETSVAVYRPGEIYTWQDLQAMRQNLDGDYVLLRDINFPSSGSDGFTYFERIGVFDKEPFTGSIDGKGHNITGFYLEATSWHAGLIGYAENATIENLVIKHSGINGSGRLAVVAGYVLQSEIINVGVESIDGALINASSYYVGGIVGQAENSTIIGYAEGDIFAKGEIVGGLVGRADNSTVTGYFKGNVTGLGTVGGLIGYAKQIQANGYVLDGTVTGGSKNTGGMVGSHVNTGTTRLSGYSRAEVVIKKAEGSNAQDFGLTVGRGYAGGTNLTYWSFSEVTLKGTAGSGYGLAGELIELNETTGKADFPLLKFDTEGGPWVWKEDGSWPGVTIGTVKPISEQDLSRASGNRCDIELHKPIFNSLDDVYEISTWQELQWANNCKDASYRLLNDIVFPNPGEDGLPAYGFQTIGNSYLPFTGTFDGQNHRISNLKIESIDNYIGFFGITSEALIKNLVIDHSGISGTLTVGGLVGKAIDTVIENVGMESSSNSQITGSTYVGGIAGSSQSSTILGYVTSKVEGGAYVGGIAGVFKSGEVAGFMTNDVTGNRNVGGLVGDIRMGSRLQGYIQGNVITGVRYLGGLTGYDDYGQAVNGYVRSTLIYGDDENVGIISGILRSAQGYISISETAMEGPEIQMQGRGGFEVTISEVNGTNYEEVFSSFTFGTRQGEWTWVADGQWPAINIGSLMPASSQPIQ